MQNKAKFRKSQMNVTKVLTKDYEKKDTWSSGKNKPNSNPIQTQYKPNQSQFQTWSEAEIPTGGLLGILKPATNLKTLPQNE